MSTEDFRCSLNDSIPTSHITVISYCPPLSKPIPVGTTNMNNMELELEQWSCSTIPNPASNSKNNVLIGDSIAVKCEPESEGRLHIKCVEIRKECDETIGIGKENSSPDTGYESDHFLCGKRRECDNFTPVLTIQSTNLSSVGRFTSEELKTEVKSPNAKEMQTNYVDVADCEALDLTISKPLLQNSRPVSPFLDFPIADERETTSTNIPTRFTGVSILESVLKVPPPIDTILSCSDGKLGAHRIVLTAASQLFYELFVDQRLEDIAVIILPDITKKTMISLLHLAYTGRMIYTKIDQDEIFSTMEALLFVGDVEKLSLFPVVTGPPVANATAAAPAPTGSTVLPSTDTPTVSTLKTNADIQSVNTLKTGTPTASHTEKDTILEIVPDSLPENRSSTSSLSKISKTKAKSNGPLLTCSHCPRTFTKQGSLQLHATKFHTEQCLASVGEMQMLAFCDICDRQYKTVSRAMFCYNQHGVTRCLTCLGVFPTTEIKEHYIKTHAKTEGDDLIVKCRWCSRSLSVKTNCSNITSHSSIHWPCANSSKGQPESSQFKNQSMKTPVQKPRKKPTKKLTPPSASSFPITNRNPTSEKLSSSASQITKSKKRHRSISSDDDFMEKSYNSSKELKRNKLQNAAAYKGAKIESSLPPQVGQRTGESADRSCGLTMTDASLLIMDTKEHQKQSKNKAVCNKTKTSAKVVVDFNNLPRLVIQLDPIEEIEYYLKKYKCKTNTMPSSNAVDESIGKNDLNYFISDSESIGTVNDSNHNRSHLEVAEESAIISTDEMEGVSSSLGHPCTKTKNAGSLGESGQRNNCSNSEGNNAIYSLNTILNRSHPQELVPLLHCHGSGSGPTSKVPNYPISCFPPQFYSVVDESPHIYDNEIARSNTAEKSAYECQLSNSESDTQLCEAGSGDMEVNNQKLSSN